MPVPLLPAICRCYEQSAFLNSLVLWPCTADQGETTAVSLFRYIDAVYLPAGPRPITGLLRLFADTEAAEYFAEQVVGGELAGDGAERFVGEAKLFRKQLQRNVFEVRDGGRQVRLRAA